jgi:Membrane bound O-acyl transferase family
MSRKVLYFCILFNYVVELFVLGFVPIKSRIVRYTAAIIHTIACVVVHQNTLQTGNEICDSFIAIYLGSLLALRMIYHFLLLPKAFVGKDNSFGKRIRYANSIIWNARMIGHPEKVKNVPEWRSGGKPTKLKFLGYKVVWFSISYIIADALTFNVTPEEVREKIQVWCAQEHEWLLRFPTLEEFNIRLFMTIMYAIMAIVSANLILQSTDFFVVGLGLVDVENCTPQFGSMAESYTVRRFWSMFWHQNLQQMVTIYAAILARLLPIKNRLFQRYFKIITAFAISGAIHELSSMVTGPHSFQLTCTIFFMLSGFAIMVEDCVQYIYMSTIKPESKTGSVWYERLIGYCWVVLFFTWATPLWSFTLSRDNTGMYFPVRFINS